MDRLTRIPHELLDEILTLIDCDEMRIRLNTFVALSRVSKPLQSRVTRFLYRIFEVSPRIYLLLRTVLNRPDLASYIHTVQLQLWSPAIANNSAYGIEATYNDADGMLLEAVISPSKQVLMPELRARLMDAAVAVLLVQLQNLKSVVLEVKDGKNPMRITRVLKALITSAVANPPYFPFLEHVKFIVPSYRPARPCHPRFDLSLLASFFIRFPAIRTVCISAITVDVWPQAMPLASTLSSLSMSSDRFEVLKQLLVGCPNLRYLNYTLSIDVRILGRCVQCEGLRRALLFVTGTLEELVLGIKLWNGKTESLEELDDKATIGRIGSLRKLKKLQKLTILTEMLLGTDCLDRPVLKDVVPQGLHELWVVDATGRIDRVELMESISKLWNARNEYAPQLEMAGLMEEGRSQGDWAVLKV